MKQHATRHLWHKVVKDIPTSDVCPDPSDLSGVYGNDDDNDCDLNGDTGIQTLFTNVDQSNLGTTLENENVHSIRLADKRVFENMLYIKVDTCRYWGNNLLHFKEFPKFH